MESKAKEEKTLDSCPHARVLKSCASTFLSRQCAFFFVPGGVLGIATVHNDGHVFCIPTCLSGLLIHLFTVYSSYTRLSTW